ncbi:MAG: Holliday junction resolvase Hjc [Zestosphaera sp.]
MGGVGGRSRGDRAERGLVHTLWRLGFAVMRAPASGARIRKAEYPDIVAIMNGKVAVFEVKSRAKPAGIYVDGEQVRKLLDFAARAGGVPYIAVRIPHREWKFIRVDVRSEDIGSTYKVGREDLENAPGIAGVLADLGLMKTLKDYTTIMQDDRSEESS